MSQVESNRFSVSLSAPVKLSLGQATNERMESLTPPFADFYMPDRLVRSQPIIGLEVTLRYRLYRKIYLGIGAGMSGAFGEREFTYGSFSLLLLPLYASVGWEGELGDRLALDISGRTGYQWHEQQFGNAGSARVILQRGGGLLGAGVGLRFRKLRYAPGLSVGYEYHRFRYRYYFPQPVPTVGDFVPVILGPVEGTPHNHLLTLGLTLRM